MRKIHSALLYFVLITTCFVIATNFSHAQASTENGWETKTAMPQAASGIKAVTVDDKIYVFASYFTYMYDTATDVWTNKSAMPTTRTGFAVAAVENKIYVLGGSHKVYRASGGVSSYPSGTNEVYDIQTDTWEHRQAMPKSIASMIGTHTVDGKIYSLDGFVYDPSVNSWSTINPPPLTHEDFSCVIDDKIYITTERYGSVYTSDSMRPDMGTLYIYDTKTNTWTNATSIPEVYTAAGMAATTGECAPKRAYVIGGSIVHGFGSIDVLKWNYVYDPANDVWTKVTDMPTARSDFAVAVVKDKVYIIGGAVGWWDRTGVVEVYTPQGYRDNSPHSSPSNLEDNQPILTETTLIIAGVAVATTVITASAITVCHYKRKPAKPT
jgi:N-acetylneuraminic acid mutarotase